MKLFKSLSLCSFLLLICVSLSSADTSANNPGYTGFFAIDRVWIENDQSQVPMVTLTPLGAPNPLTGFCTRDDLVAIRVGTDPLFDEKYTAVMAIKTTERTINLYINNCDDQGFPVADPSRLGMQ